MDLGIFRFQAIRRLVTCMKYNIGILEEIRSEHDCALDKVTESLADIEFFLKDKYNIDVELQHLIKHMEFLDEERFNYWRKKILDQGNALKRELEDN